MTKKLEPLTPEFFKVAIAAGTIVPPIEGPDRSLGSKLLWRVIYLLIFLGVAGFVTLVLTKRLIATIFVD